MLTYGFHYDVKPEHRQEFLKISNAALTLMKTLPGHIETKLMEDFSTLEKLYFFIYKDENNVERSSFINNRQIFYQLLLKHKYHCSKEDFSLLKTIDRLALQDSITEGLFKELGWKYVSLF